MGVGRAGTLEESGRVAREGDEGDKRNGAPQEKEEKRRINKSESRERERERHRIRMRKTNAREEQFRPTRWLP